MPSAFPTIMRRCSYTYPPPPLWSKSRYLSMPGVERWYCCLAENNIRVLWLNPPGHNTSGCLGDIASGSDWASRQWHTNTRSSRYHVQLQIPCTVRIISSNTCFHQKPGFITHLPQRSRTSECIPMFKSTLTCSILTA